MRVGVDRELDAGRERFARSFVAQIEPIGQRVDLEHGPGSLRGANHGREIEIDRLARADQAPRRVEQQIDVRILDGAQHASRHLLAALPEAAVHGRAHDIELREHAIVDVERAVVANVRLRPGQHAEAAQLAVQRTDLGGLGEQARLVIAAREAEIPRVIGDRDVFEPERLRRRRHLLDRCAAVGPARVHLQISAQRSIIDQPRELPISRRLDLAGVLAQLRRNEGQLERRVHRGLALARETAVAVEEPVLVQLEPGLDGDPPQLQVVRLAAGEIDQRGAEALGGHDAQVGVHPVREPHQRLALAARVDADDFRQVGERLGQRARIARRRQEVEITDALLAAPQRARDLDARDARDVAELRRQPARELGGFAERVPRGRGSEQSDARENPALGALAEVRERAHALRTARGFELRHVAHSELFVERHRGLGPDALDRREREHVDRPLRSQALEVAHAPRPQQLRDPARDAGANARQRIEPLLTACREDRAQRLARSFHDEGRFLIGARAKGRVLHLEAQRELAQRASDLRVASRAVVGSQLRHSSSHRALAQTSQCRARALGSDGRCAAQGCSALHAVAFRSEAGQSAPHRQRRTRARSLSASARRVH